MLEFYYLGPLAFSVIFLTVGLVTFLSQRGKGNQLHKNLTMTLSIGSVGAGMLLLGLALLSPSMASRRAQMAGALHSPVVSIDEIDLNPGPNSEPDQPSLTVTSIAIHDRAKITEIADALDHASALFPNHPATKWLASITIKTKTSNYYIVVRQSFDSENGTLIELKSGPTERGAIATFRSDRLGEILERLAQDK